MKRTLAPILLCIICISTAAAQTRYQKDFEFYWQTIADNFAYFHTQKTDWDKVKALYQPVADTITDTNVFIHFLEKLNNELYNGHVFLNSNTPGSNRIIPSGSDLKLSWIEEKFVITELREGFNAEECGLVPGMAVEKFNGIPMPEAIKDFLPRSAIRPGKTMYEYAANMLLAGTHDRKRVITTTVNGKEKIFYPDTAGNKTEEAQSRLVMHKKLAGNIGYIKIYNSLGDPGLIPAFDQALDSLLNTIGVILDLRETPSGGNTTVARAIMGRFVNKEQPYQKHIYSNEEKETGIKRSTLELVSPRGTIYKKPLMILVGYWTASMGEGMAVGFHGMQRASIIGTRMAGLLGEIYTFRMPETNIGFSFPCVQLQHINGTARENFIPPVLVKDQRQSVDIARGMLITRHRQAFIK